MMRVGGGKVIVLCLEARDLGLLDFSSISNANFLRYRTILGTYRRGIRRGGRFGSMQSVPATRAENRVQCMSSPRHTA